MNVDRLAHHSVRLEFTSAANKFDGEASRNRTAGTIDEISQPFCTR